MPAKLRSCGVLVVRGDPIDSFLLMQHHARWDIPKGHIEPGETDLECALRETWEETGIEPENLQIIRGFRYEENYVVNFDDSNHDKTLIVFLGRLIEDCPITVSEHIGHEWLPWNPPHVIQEKTVDPLLADLDRFLQKISQK